MPDTCVFCRRDLVGTAAEEHVFPQWLLNHLSVPRSDQMFQGVGSMAMLDADETEGRVHGTWRFVEGRVCRTCNNGWLSQLEEDARPVLQELMEGAGTIVASTPTQRRIIARWAAKTAFLVANVSPFNHPVPAGHLWALDEGGDLPPGVAVYAGQAHTGTKTAYLQSTTWPQFTARQDGYIVGALRDGYKIGLQFKDLMLLVAFAPMSGVRFVTAACLHFPLNPDGSIWPSYTAPMPEQPQPPLWIFTRSLAAVVL